MDRDQKWMLGIASLSLAASLSAALFLSENKKAKKKMRHMMHDIKKKM
ncbi:MAG: hypothetical protein ACK5LC_17110 [Coprobacillaceae bacterium]